MHTRGPAANYDDGSRVTDCADYASLCACFIEYTQNHIVNVYRGRVNTIEIDTQTTPKSECILRMILVHDYTRDPKFGLISLRLYVYHIQTIHMHGGPTT